MKRLSILGSADHGTNAFDTMTIEEAEQAYTAAGWRVLVYAGKVAQIECEDEEGAMQCTFLEL